MSSCLKTVQMGKLEHQMYDRLNKLYAKEEWLNKLNLFFFKIVLFSSWRSTFLVHVFFLFFSSSHFQSLTSFAVWLSLPIVPNKFRQVVKIKFVKWLSVWALVVVCSSFYSIISASMPILKALPAEKRECTRRCVWSEQILLLKLEIVKKTNGLLSCLNMQ